MEVFELYFAPPYPQTWRQPWKRHQNRLLLKDCFGVDEHILLLIKKVERLKRRMLLSTPMKKFTLKCKNLAASEIEKKIRTLAAEIGSLKWIYI